MDDLYHFISSICYYFAGTAINDQHKNSLAHVKNIAMKTEIKIQSGPILIKLKEYVRVSELSTFVEVQLLDLFIQFS